jgi:acyl-CoA synthetase (AMP-forming)/AMP-acid ligase II
MDLITDTTYRNVTLAQVAAARATERPNETALRFDSGHTLSFAEAWRQANALAIQIQRLGVTAGATLTFQLPNVPESVPVAIAASICGLVINPVVPIYRGKELGFILNDAKSEILFIPHRIRGFDYVDMITSLRPSLPHLRHVICCGAEEDLSDDVLRYETLMTDAPSDLAAVTNVDPNDTKVILYTSGTTGNPKAVRHSHNTLAKALDNGVDAWQLGEDDMMLMPSPVTHVTGYVNGIELPFFTECKVLLMESWVVDKAIPLIERYRATSCVSATPFLRELVDACRDQRKTLPGFRIFACGGAAVPAALIYEANEVLADCRAVRVYGSTEVPLVTVGFIKEDETQLAAETDGKVCNYDVRICNDEGVDVGLNTEGEIWVRGPAMMQGYRETSQNEAAFSEDGFFKTGDIGQLLDTHAIVITDRKKDIIIRGGENLSAREIEEAVMQHPDVMEAAAVSAPHRRLGEGVAIFITLYEGGTAPTLEALATVCSQLQLAKQKWPQWLGVTPEMPKTPSGKIQKSVLRQSLQDQGVLLG